MDCDMRHAAGTQPDHVRVLLLGERRAASWGLGGGCCARISVPHAWSQGVRAGVATALYRQWLMGH